MEIEPAASRLKIDINIEVNGQTAFRAHVDAEGDAQALRPIGEQLSASIAQAIARVVGSPSAGETSAQAQPVAANVVAAQLTSPPVVANQPATISQPPAASRQPARSALPIWLTDNRRLTLSFGGVLVLAAILVTIVFPSIVPPAQRIEVFMMSLAFGLIGSATLFAGALPKRNASSNLAGNVNAAMTSASAASSTTSSSRTSSSSQASAQTINKPNGAKSRLVLDARRRALLQAQESRKPLGALWGFGFGVLFLVAGIVAPFVLGQANADERFLMMLGFAPVAVTGALMIGLFWRTLSRVATPDGKTTGPAGFRIGVPVAIGILLVVLFVVIGLVLLGTLLPILSR